MHTKENFNQIDFFEEEFGKIVKYKNIYNHLDKLYIIKLLKNYKYCGYWNLSSISFFEELNNFIEERLNEEETLLYIDKLKINKLIGKNLNKENLLNILCNNDIYNKYDILSMSNDDIILKKLFLNIGYLTTYDNFILENKIYYKYFPETININNHNFLIKDIFNIIINYDIIQNNIQYPIINYVSELINTFIPITDIHKINHDRLVELFFNINQNNDSNFFHNVSTVYNELNKNTIDYYELFSNIKNINKTHLEIYGEYSNNFIILNDELEKYIENIYGKYMLDKIKEINRKLELMFNISIIDNKINVYSTFKNNIKYDLVKFLG